MWLFVEAADDQRVLMVNLHLWMWEQRQSHLGLIVTSLCSGLYLREILRLINE